MNDSTSQKRILIVDDEKAFRDILRSFVESLGYVCADVGSGEEALGMLKKTHFSIVISDIVMPGMDGLELLRAIKKRHADVDILIITAHRGEYSAMRIVQAGASDFLAKPFSMEQLGARLYKIEMERSLRSKLYFKSITDELTGLYNRGYFYQKLRREAERAKRQGHPLSIIILDVDGFKQFNDRHGHLRGDALLRMVARVVQLSVREHVDDVFRYGGDEFVVILPETDERMAALIGDRIKAKFSDTAPAGMTLSLGTAESRGDEDTEALVNLADRRMYEEKSRAKGLENPQLKMGVEKDNHHVRCLSCGTLVHWTASICKNCLADPLKRTDPYRSQEIVRAFFREVHPSLDDRRRFPRIRVRGTVLDPRLPARVHNISWGGVQIETGTPVWIGKSLTLCLPVDDDEGEFKGVVVYVDASEGGSVAGVQFSEISDHESRLLKRLLDIHSGGPA